MKKQNQLISGFCKALHVSEDELSSTSQKKETVERRYVFAAIYLKTYYPTLLSNVNLDHPVGLIGELGSLLQKSKGAVSKILVKSRFYYRTYQQFKEKVDTIEEKINAA